MRTPPRTPSPAVASNRSDPASDRPPGPEAVLQNPNRYPEVDAASLGPWLRRLLAEIAPHADTLTVRFAGDRLVRRVNRQYRDKDRTTDVLSFPGGETPEGFHLGDVLISVPQARRQAPGEEGAASRDPAALHRELQRLVLHGVLHCMGYDHETDEGEMERLEERLRRQWIEEMGHDGGRSHGP